MTTLSPLRAAGARVAVLSRSPRILAPADYGLMAIVSVVSPIVANLAELGMGALLVQARRLEPAGLAKVAGFVWLLHLGLGALLVIAALLAGWVFADARLPPLFQIAALQFVFIALGAVPQDAVT